RRTGRAARSASPSSSRAGRTTTGRRRLSTPRAQATAPEYTQKRAVRLDRRAGAGSRGRLVPPGSRALDCALPLAEPREAAAARGRGGRREDRGREVGRDRARGAADPPAVLR